MSEVASLPVDLLLHVDHLVRIRCGQVRIRRRYLAGRAAPSMQFDRQDIFPLSVVLLFGLVIPFGAWLGLGTRQQISHDLLYVAKAFAIASFVFAVLIGFFSIFGQRRAKRILTERGEQSPADFVAQFASESERHAATIVFDTLRELSAAKQMPRLERRDQMSGPPLFLAQGDLEQRLETLCQELDLSLWIDPDGSSALYGAETVEQLVLALAHLIARQGTRSALVGDSGR